MKNSSLLSQGFSSSLLIAASTLYSAQAWSFEPIRGLITQAERVDIVSDACAKLKQSYSLWDIKKIRGVADGEAICSAAESLEAALPDVDASDSALRAEANLGFYSRIESLIAQFQDSHMYISAMMPMSPFDLPFDLQKLGNDYVIAAVFKEVMPKIDGKPALEVGDTITQIDGRPVGAHVTEMLPYAGGSSRAFSEITALGLVTSRRYPGPAKTKISVKGLRKKDRAPFTTEVEWVLNASALLIPNKDQADYAVSKKMKILVKTPKPAASTPAQTEPNKMGGMATLSPKLSQQLSFTHGRRVRASAFLQAQAAKPSTEETPKAAPGELTFESQMIYRDPQSGDVVISSGRATLDGKQYGALAIYSYDSLTLVQQYPGVPIPVAMTSFQEAIINELKEFEKAKLPLILDLRSNPGGNLDLVQQLTSLLTPQGSDQKTSWAIGYRITNYTANMFANIAAYDPNGAIANGYDGIARAVDAGKSHSFGQNLVSPEPPKDKKGTPQTFTGKTVALVGPDCISACDVTALLLKTSKKAKLLGLPTNGTGAGYLEAAPFSSQSRTLAHAYIELSFPSTLFGLGTTEKENSLTMDEISTENRPVVPDYAYTPGLADFNNDTGWLKAAIKALQSSY